MSFIPYKPNAEAWKKHYQAMADGKMDYMGSFYRVADTGGSNSEKAESIKVVAPTAQVVEQAKSELKRENQQSTTQPQRVSTQFPNRKAPSKRGKSKFLKEPESDFFSV